MNAIRLLILTMLCTTSLFAQTFSIKGKVVDTDNQPLSFVTILLYPEEASEAMTGTATDENGYFFLDGITKGSYSLAISFVGFETQSHQIVLTDVDLSIKDVHLEASTEALDETVLTVKRPTVVKEPGKLVFNVENTSLSTGSTLDLLTKTPGVLVIQDQISIKKAPTTIFINGKRVYLSPTEVSSLLRNLDASVVKSVEVITNPSASYDAETGAILNIVTSKNVSIGYKGTINGRYEQATYPKYNLGTSQFYKNDWLNFYADYSYSPAKEYKYQYDYIRFFEPDRSVKAIWDTDFTRTTKSHTHQGNLIADFTLNENNGLSISSNIYVLPYKKFNNTVDAEIYNAQMQLDSTFQTLSAFDNDQYNLSFSGDYKTIIDSKGTSLTTTVNYILYNDEQEQNVSTNYYLANGDFSNNDSFYTQANQNSDILTVALDLNLPLEEASLDGGAKFSNIDTNSALDYYNIENSDLIYNPSLSDNFVYDESIYATYLNFDKDWEKWDFGIGLRAEYTVVKGTSRDLGEIDDQNYFDLFPSVSIQNQIDDSNSIGLSYARHIQRPRYQSLNPFKYFLNQSNYNSGNPYLVPAIDDKITLSYNYKSKLFFDLYYHGTKDALSILKFQDNENMVMSTIDENLIEEFQYSLDILYISSVTPWWYLSVYTSGFYFENEFYALESVEEKYSNSTFGFYGQLYNGLTISKNKTVTGDVTAVYLSNFIYGSYDYSNQFSMSFSIRKSFWDNTASITAGVNDIFDTFNVPVTSQYYNQDNSYFAQPESRMFRIGFRYTYGNAILRDNNRDRKPEETGRLEKN